MHYKKILIVVFLICLIFLPFVLKKEEKKTKFTFWTVQLKAPVGDLIQKNIDEFQEKHKDIEIVWVDIPITEAQKRTIASILGGNPPDLINLNPEFSTLLAQKNSLEYFSEEDTKDYNKGLVDKLKYEGKIYALPFYATSAVTIVNKNSFKNCNVTLLKYDDILKLKSCENPPVFGIALNEGDSFAKILNKYGANTEKEIDDVYNLFNQMRKNNLLLKDTLTVNHREVIEKYMSNSAGFISAGSNFISMIKQNAPDVYKNSIITPQLTGTTGEFDISIMNFIIPKRAKNKELALEFAKLLLNEENQLELAKKTNVLPANQNVLNTAYFKNCSSELTESARCTAAKQLNKPLSANFGSKNKKEINEVINKSLETLFLKGGEDFKKYNTFESIQTLMQN